MHTIKSVFVAFLGIITFYISYLLATFIMVFLAKLFKNSAIDFLINFFLLASDSAGIGIYIFATSSAMLAASTVMGWICGSNSEMSHAICGIVLIVLNLLFLVVNIISKNSWTTNIFFVIAGFQIWQSSRY